MRTLRILPLIVAAITLCCYEGSAGQNVAGTAVTNQEGLVEVIVFHGVKQCQTCEAIKKNTKEVVEEKFGNLPDGKKVVFRIVDFSLPENKEIAGKYEIAWTSVLLIKHHADGKETVNNISEFAIRNARTNTEAFRTGLAGEIAQLLN